MTIGHRLRLLGLVFLGFAGITLTTDTWGATEGAPLILTPGEQRLLRFPGLSRYSLSGAGVRGLPLPPALARSPEEARETLLLKALSPGAGDLWVWHSDGSAEHRPIQVLSAAAIGNPGLLEKALGSLNEVEVYRAGEQATLRGEVRSAEECSRITALEGAFPTALRNETRLSSELEGNTRTHLTAWLNTFPARAALRIEVSALGPQLTGALPDPRERDEALRQVRQIAPCARIAISSLPDEAPTVYFRVFLLELKRDRLRSFGAGWPPGQLDAFQVTTAGISESLRLDVAIQALEQEGAARVLSNPELAVRAPGEAELFAGGEIPVRARSAYSSDVKWKSYGLLLRLKVTHQAGDSVRVEIGTEVSHLDEKISDQELPSLQANRMRTQVDARFGRPLMLSGLLQQKERENARGLPWLRQIPVLGSLFGSKDFQQERSELVAVLLPLREPPSAAPLQPHREPRSMELPGSLSGEGGTGGARGSGGVTSHGDLLPRRAPRTAAGFRSPQFRAALRGGRR